jgi:polyphosphate glucokinase
MRGFGVDIGGSGIKGAVVDLVDGRLVGDRHRIPTPQPSTPEAVAATVGELVTHFGWAGSVGCTFPAVVQHGVALTAANVDKSWIGTDVDALITATIDRDTHVMNDADAAGVAEVRFGAGKDHPGVVLMTTLGTGIGSALFVDGHLVPNTEFGHLRMGDTIAEAIASDAARSREDLGWAKWAKRLSEYYSYLDFILNPDLIIIGGGVSKKHAKYVPLITGVRCPIVPATLLNEAGIIGAALIAAEAAAAAARGGDGQDGEGV